MRNRIPVLLAAFSLLLAAPMLAQSPEPTSPEQEPTFQAEPDPAGAAHASSSPQLEVPQEAEAQEEPMAPATGTATGTDSGLGSVADAQPEYDAGTTNEANESGDELPATAGLTPLFALAGALGLGSALGFRAQRRR